MKYLDDLLNKIRSVTRRRAPEATGVFSSTITTQRWLEGLPSLSEYELHHALVEGLERFNGDVRGDVVNRIKVLKVMEETGISAQNNIVAEYLNTPESNSLARQTLWREAHSFWQQMSMAYLQFSRQLLKGEDKVRLLPWSAEIVLRDLHYAGLSMRWEYFRGKHPGALTWRRMHRIYRMAEISGLALSEIELDGQKTSCSREYVLVLLFDLINPHVFQPSEVQIIVNILGGSK